MAIESREEIMARLNNPYGYAPAQPKAASDFTNYVLKLMEEPNPQGGMMTDAEAYRADPLRRQNAINASLDEALKKKQAEEAARAAGGMGMMGSVSGESGGGVPLTQEQIDFLGRETPEERYARITGDWFGLKPMGMMMLDPIATFLTYPKQDPSNVIVETRTGKTPAQIAQEQREAEAAAVAARAAEIARQQQISINADPYTQVPFTSADYYTPQDRSSYSDYQGAGQSQMDRSLQTQSDFYG